MNFLEERICKDGIVKGRGGAGGCGWVADGLQEAFIRF